MKSEHAFPRSRKQDIQKVGKSRQPTPEDGCALPFRCEGGGGGEKNERERIVGDVVCHRRRRRQSNRVGEEEGMWEDDGRQKARGCEG